jgi:hypothetical protein
MEISFNGLTRRNFSRTSVSGTIPFLVTPALSRRTETKAEMRASAGCVKKNVFHGKRQRPCPTGNGKKKALVKWVPAPVMRDLRSSICCERIRPSIRNFVKGEPETKR